MLSVDLNSCGYKHANARNITGCTNICRENPWAVWELFSDPFSPTWVFCLPCKGSSLFCGGRFSYEINEKLHLSHEKSIFTIYLTSCIPRAHIRRCWLMLAYSSVFWCIHRHCWDLLWVSCPPLDVPIESFCIPHVHCRETHSSEQKWNMAHNWKSERLIEYSEHNKASWGLSKLLSKETEASLAHSMVSGSLAKFFKVKHRTL